jgi:transcriptional regulator with XRE-family HTH domain
MSRSNFTRRTAPRTCLRCDEPVRARGLCNFHYNKLRKHLRARGQFESVYVPNTATLNHIAVLRAAGVGWPRLAELTGLSRMTLDHLVDPGRTMVFRRTEAAVLAIPIPVAHSAQLADGAKVPIVGSRRRLRGLARAGYSQDDICRRLGLAEGMSSMSKLFSGSQLKITASNARRIAALFAELELVPGPSQRAVRDAKRKGWPHPLEWDEDTIDDPAAEPHAPLRAAPPLERGRPIPDDFAEIVAEHRELGRTDNDIAQRLGIKLGTLQSRMQRLERCAS